MLNISIPKDQWILSRLAKKPTLGSGPPLAIYFDQRKKK
jgi:hypothetical protein